MAWIVGSFFLFVVAWLWKALEWEKVFLFSFFIPRETQESQAKKWESESNLMLDFLVY